MDENNQKYMLDLIDGAHGRTVIWMGRAIIGLILAIAVLVVAFAYTVRKHEQALLEENQAWLDYLAEYDFVTETTEYTQDSNGLNIIAEGNGVNVNGTTLPQDGESKSENKNGDVQQKDKENLR